MYKKHVITFAAPVATTKSQISYYLSINNNLPILNNDSLRKEIFTKFAVFDGGAHKELLINRLEQAFELGNNFILDASIDRQWGFLKEEFLDKYGFGHFIISLDLTNNKIRSLYNSGTGLNEDNHARETFDDHQKFLMEYADLINVSITDEKFEDRFLIADNSYKSYLKEFR